jgi:hypothetical protein
MDGLNYGREFFNIKGNFWTLSESRVLVREFVEAASNSGWKLEVFIDAGISSKEGEKKWLTRREADVRAGTLGI